MKHEKHLKKFLPKTKSACAKTRRERIVSDHAVLRYMERVMGLDVEAVRTRIAKDTEGARKLGASAANVDEVRYRISNTGIVTTCY